MGNRILICGPNGAGKTTLGRALSAATGWKFMDAEDYFFPGRLPDSAYGTPVSKSAVQAALMEDMRIYPDLIVASVTGDYGEDVAARFTCALYLRIPKELSSARVRSRAYAQFGDRMLPGGDLHAQESAFFEMVDRRPEGEVEAWLASAGLPYIELDGTRTVSENISIALKNIVKR